MADEPTTHINATDARGAEKPRVTRYVLSISLALIVILFAIVLIVWR